MFGSGIFSIWPADISDFSVTEITLHFNFFFAYAVFLYLIIFSMSPFFFPPGIKLWIYSSVWGIIRLRYLRQIELSVLFTKSGRLAIYFQQ